MTDDSVIINMPFFWWGQMREVLNAYAWDDPSFRWKEGKGWFSRNFYIKGSLSDIENLKKRFDGWCLG